MVRVPLTFATALAVMAALVAIRDPLLGAQSPEDRAVAALAAQPTIQAALNAAKINEPQTIESQVRLTEIPAPSFKEAARGAEMRRLFQEAGLQGVRIDRAGNVLGERPGAALHPHVVVAAHLDTVFPEGTNVRVRRSGAVLSAPGIGDDSRGLAVLVAIARALKEANVQTPGSITFVADVGEEGLGDLRGMKALFDEPEGTVDRFIDRRHRRASRNVCGPALLRTVRTGRTQSRTSACRILSVPLAAPPLGL